MSATDSIFRFPPTVGQKYLCECPGCIVVFTRGEGGRRLDARFCSNKCKQKAWREGGLSPIQKVDEVNIMAAQLHRQVEELLDRAKAIGEQIDVLENAATVARLAHVDSFIKELS